MSRPIYVLVYHSPIFAAHWGLWIPSYDRASIGDVGKVIQVQGSSSQGFVHEFERNLELSTSNRRHSLKLLCWVDVDVITSTTGPYSVDSIAVDTLEEMALVVQPPGPSLRPSEAIGVRTRIELKNCQTWLRELVCMLVDKGIFPEDALVNLDQAPKN